MQDESHSPPSPAEQNEIIEQFDRRFSRAGLRKRRLNRLLQSGVWLVWIQLLTGAKRCLDFLLATALLVGLSPLLLLLYMGARVRGGGILRTQRLGRWGTAYTEFSFTSGPMRRLPALFNVWKGDLSLVGPRALSQGQFSAADRAAWRRFNIRPGLICLWWVRRRANIAWGNEFESDSEYLDTQSFWGDIALGLRAIPAALYGEGVAAAPDRIKLLGIPVDNLTMDEAIEAILERAGSEKNRGASATQLCFINADCVNIAHRDAEYRSILLTSQMLFADGIGVKLAGRILNTNIRQNLNGTDLFPMLCDAMKDRNIGFYLLGGRPGVVDDVAAWISRRCPDLPVRGKHHGFFTEAETGAIVQDIRESGAEILLVAFGCPKQEKWIRRHLSATGVKVAMGVGGLFDFYSGRIPRAPVWVREIAMEWFYRFLQEPGRMWKRYFVGNSIFLFRVLAHRFSAGDSQ
jgi:N-acetylglucosaminyldiphosphoundecaprenol N-acetyl-beta-D-mannosaminyltransferase